MTPTLPPPPTLDLDGFRLRPLLTTDAEALHDYLRDPAVTELTAYPVVTPELADAIIEKCRGRWAAGELSKWGIARTDDDRIVGTCGFNEWSPAHRWAELAYDLSRECWGRGLMSGIVNAVLRWTFGTFERDQVDRVHAYVRVDNLRSQKLLERAGFVREGCLRSFRVCRGQPHDFYIYSLLRSEWGARHSNARSSP